MSERFLLDTNVVAAFSRPEAGSSVIQWLHEQVSEGLFIASIVLGEVWQGIAALPDGRKKQELAAWFTGSTGPQVLFSGRILPLDEAAALQWAEYIAEGRRLGRPRSPIDMQIAAIAKVNGCVLVTSNLRDFEPVRGDLALLNPAQL